MPAFSFCVNAASHRHHQGAYAKKEIHQVAVRSIERIEAVPHAQELYEDPDSGDFYSDYARGGLLARYLLCTDVTEGSET